MEVATFDAVDTESNATVALRLVHPNLSADPDFIVKFNSAMEAAAALHHPNLATIVAYGADTWNGRTVLYVASEYLSGGSLRDLLDRGRLLSPSQGLMVGLEACKGLDALHRAGLIHGEIRPATLIFGDDSRLRIIDVGLSQVVDEWIWSPGQEPRQELAMYSGPERRSGELQPKSDIYGLALTIVEAVTGQLPFVGENATATLAARVDRLLPVSADLGALAAVLERAARPDAADRYSAVEFGKALMNTASRLPRPAPIPTLSGGLFADRAKPGEPEEPTGPVTRPVAVVADQAPPADDAASTVAPMPDTIASTDLAAVADANEVPAIDRFEPTADDGDVGDDTAGDSSTIAGAATAVPSAAAAAGVLPPPTSAPISAPGFRYGGPSQPTEMLGMVEPEAKPNVAPTRIESGSPAVTPPSTTTLPTTATFPPTEPLYLPATPTAEPTRVMPIERGVPVPGVPSTPELYDEGPRRRVPWWIYPLVLLFLAGGGVAAWLLSRTPSHTVPDVTGVAEAEARNLLAPNKWTITTGNEPSDLVAVGVVIRTDPPAGTKLAEDKTLMLLVSSGPAPRTIPELVDKPYETAKAELEKLGLVVERADDKNDENVPKGSVLGFTVPESPSSVAGSTVIKGTKLVLTVSSGPAPRVAPQLSTLTLEAAKAQLEQLGLTMTQVPDVFDNTIPAGQVATQDPPAGSSIERGATVNVAVSKGPDLVVVPIIDGLDATGISSALQNAGFVVGATTGDPSQPLIGMTSAGAPVVGGGQLIRGSTIDLEFAPTPTTTTVAASVEPPTP